MNLPTQFCPAKINLMLRVLGRRDDGYHNLQTLFLLLDWGDLIDARKTSKNGHEVDVSGVSAVAAEDNLIHRASRLLVPHATKPGSWLFSVNKKIPQGGGMGGGSANAAFTLQFLNQAWACGKSDEELAEIGLSLGADVPVFVRGNSALATGVGEQLEPMDFSIKQVLLLFPECHINTAQLFISSDLCRDQVPLNVRHLKDPDFWINDFFPVLLSGNSEVFDLYQRLRPHMLVRLSGTGSTMFALFEDEAMAKEAEEIASRFCRCALVRPLIGNAWKEQLGIVFD